MNNDCDEIIEAPDRSHRARLRNVGEARFGPPCFSLRLDEYAFGRRIFGASCLWSPDSRYLAVQEWTTLDPALGPLTALLLVDAEAEQEATLAHATQGFIVPQRFEGKLLIYTKHYPAQGITRHFDLDITHIKSWRKLPVGDIKL